MFGRKEKPKPIVVTDLLHAHDLLLHPGSESVIPSLTYILSTIRSQPSLCHTFSYKLVALVVQVGLYGSVGDEEERIQKSDALKQKLCLCILIELYRGNPEGRYTDYGTRDNISLTRDTHDLPVGGDGSDNHNSVSGYLVYSKVMSWVMKTLGAGQCCLFSSDHHHNHGDGYTNVTSASYSFYSYTPHVSSPSPSFIISLYLIVIITLIAILRLCYRGYPDTR